MCALACTSFCLSSLSPMILCYLLGFSSVIWESWSWKLLRKKYFLFPHENIKNTERDKVYLDFFHKIYEENEFWQLPDSSSREGYRWSGVVLMWSSGATK